jgi:hypothetical protein
MTISSLSILLQIENHIYNMHNFVKKNSEDALNRYLNICPEIVVFERSKLKTLKNSNF